MTQLISVLLLLLAPFYVFASEGPSFWSDPAGWLFVNGFLLINYIFISLPYFLVDIAGKAFSFAVQHGLVEFATYYNQYFDTAIDSAWTLSRDIANIIIISMFVFVAIGTILRLKNYNLEKFAVKIIIIAVLINFSMFFVKFAIDVSNLIAFQLYKGVEKMVDEQVSILDPEAKDNTDFINIGTIIASKIGANKLLDAKQLYEYYTDDTKSNKLTNLLISMLATTVTLSLAAGVLAYGTIVIFTRILGLLYVIALSAAAFVAMVVPKVGENFFNKWLDNLVRYTLFAPLFILTLFVSLKIIIYIGSKSGAEKTIADIIASSGGVSQLGEALLFVFVIIGALFASIKIANSLSIIGANFASDVALRVTGVGTWAAKKAFFQPAAAGLFRVANSKWFQNTPVQLYAAKMYDVARAPTQSKLMLDQFNIKRGLSYGDKKFVEGVQSKRELDKSHSILRNIEQSFKKELSESKVGSAYQMPQQTAQQQREDAQTAQEPRRDTTPAPDANIPNPDDPAARAQEEAREAGEFERQQRRATQAAEEARRAAQEVAESEFKNLHDAQRWVDSISTAPIDGTDDEAEIKRLYAERIRKILNNPRLRNDHKMEAIARERNIMMDKIAELRERKKERDERYKTTARSKKTARKLEAAKAIAKHLDAKLTQELINNLESKMQDESISGEDRVRLATFTEEVLTSDGTISERLKRAKVLLDNDTRLRALNADLKDALKRELDDMLQRAQSPRDFLKSEATSILDNLAQSGYSRDVIGRIQGELERYNGNAPVEFIRNKLSEAGFRDATKEFDDLHKIEKLVNNSKLHTKAINRALSSKNKLAVDEALKKYQAGSALDKIKKSQENIKSKIKSAAKAAEESSVLAQAAGAAIRQATQNIKETSFGLGDYKSENKSSTPNPKDLFKYESDFVEEVKNNLDELNDILKGKGLEIKKKD